MVNAAATVSSPDLSCDEPGEEPDAVQTGDCDDNNPNRFPTNPEVVDDGVDQNCDGGDLCYADADNDGFRPIMPTTVASSDLDCSDPFEATPADPASDCDDFNPDRFPGHPEVVNDGVDQNCDGGDLCYLDADNDGFRPVMPTTVASSDLDCTDSGEATAADPASDCDDSNPAGSPPTPK